MAYTFASSYSAPIIALYLLMVWRCRWLMKRVGPLDLRRPLMAHNLACSLLSLYAVVCFLLGFWQVIWHLVVELHIFEVIYKEFVTLVIV